ncbi:MAG: glycosyltransferase [Clostridia bacterium]
MKLLILSSNNGQGHNSAGRALMEQAEKRKIPCGMVDALSLFSRAESRTMAGIHVQSARYAPQLFAIGNRVAEQMTRTKNPSYCYYANAIHAGKLAKYIADNAYDTVVSTHVFPAETLTYLLRCVTPDLPAYFVETDYTCTPFVGETELTGYFIPHAALAQEFVDCGVPEEKLIATGIPVSERFCCPVDRKSARRTLGLPQDCPIVLVMTGSMGFGNVNALLSAVLHTLPDDARLCVMCGNNEKLKAGIHAEIGNEGRVLVQGYTDQIPLYMDASDVLLTKPGGLSVTEAAVHGIPLVLTTPIPGWEAKNVAFFTDMALAYSGTTPEMAAMETLRLLNNAHARHTMRERQNSEINAYAAQTIIDTLLLHERFPREQINESSIHVLA